MFEVFKQIKERFQRLRRIYMRAHDPERNVDRDWECLVTPDLFGNVIVQTNWGRVGEKGCRTVRIFPDETSALRHYRKLLRRRATARLRIGTSYRIIASSGD